MEEKLYQRRDSAELALEKKYSSSIARFKETQRKNSSTTAKSSTADSLHDLFYAPNRPSQRAVDQGTTHFQTKKGMFTCRSMNLRGS